MIIGTYVFAFFTSNTQPYVCAMHSDTTPIQHFFGIGMHIIVFTFIGEHSQKIPQRTSSLPSIPAIHKLRKLVSSLG